MIRPAMPSDAPGIAALVNPVIRDTAITFTSAEKTPADLAQSITRSQAYFVAVDGTQVIGYACYFQFRAGPGYAHTMEHSITLAPEARGRGLGRRIMTMLEHSARARGTHALMAGISGENSAGVDFHTAIGFRQVGRLLQVGHKFDRWIDLVLMQKFL